MKEELGIKKIDDYYKYRVNIEKAKILKLNNVASFVKKYGYCNPHRHPSPKASCTGWCNSA